MMRRSSNRNKSAASGATSLFSSGRSASKELDKIDAFFGQYADRADPSSIGPEGVERLCAELQVDPADLRILLLAWKMNAARMGYFTKEEWRKAMAPMHVDSVDKLRKALDILPQEVAHPTPYEAFFLFAFRYCLTEPLQKTIDLETAAVMLRLVAGSRPHLDPFLLFLQHQKEYKVLNMDQWSAFLHFSMEVRTDFSNYDENLAWPLLFDNFVEWGREQLKAGQL